jgi:hypothetical protein
MRATYTAHLTLRFIILIITYDASPRRAFCSIPLLLPLR